MASLNTIDRPPYRTLQGKIATIAALSRKERHPANGEKRRQQVAMVLGTLGGAASVLAVKSAATATALWAGAPALVVAGAGLAAVMAASGGMGYFKQRAVLKAAGNPLPAFRVKDLLQNMLTSKAALVAGGMTAVAAVLPGALMLVAGSGVAALGAGLHEYTSRRAEERARGIVVGRPRVRDAFRAIFKSKSAGTAFLLSAGIGSVLSVLTGASLDVPAAESAPPSAGAFVSVVNDLPAHEITHDVVQDKALEPPLPMPEMVEQLQMAEHPPLPPELPAWKQTGDVTAVEPVKAEPVKAEPVKAVESVVNQTPAPAIAAPAPREILFDATGADGVRQILYGSGVIETIYPAGHDNAAPASAPPAQEAPAQTAPVPAPEQENQAAPARAPAVSDVTDENGVRTIVHASGLRETIIPAYASAAQAAPVLPPAGECVISETETEINIGCVVDVQTDIQPGSGIDFRAAASPEKVFHATLSADSAPINAGEFLEDHAVPAAQSAYEKGYFKPQIN